MTKLTYAEAYDKIIQAYFRDEIKPFDPTFCFCGTLANNWKWTLKHTKNSMYDYEYSFREFKKMESALLNKFVPMGLEIYKSHERTCEIGCEDDCIDNPLYEDALFAGMCAALDVLKEIHRARGEDVDAIKPVFSKRKLLVRK